jgi:hypothetical protein
MKLPVFDINTWKRTEKELGQYEPVVKIKAEIEKSVAYIFSQEREKLVKLLMKHRIQLSRFKAPAELDVEAYTILHVNRVMEEDKLTEYVDADVRTVSKTIEKGDVIVYLNQKAGNLLPLLLEPQSSYSICTERSGREYRFEDYLTEGREYPIYRLMENNSSIDVE